MPNYTKLFSSIVTSTIWTEDDKTRILWITMLAIADQYGEVHASVPGLARLAGLDLESTERALDVLSSPDKYSRTPDNEGRRIAAIPGGWELLNHAKYRAMASKEDSRSANAARQKRHRDRNATVTPRNATVTPRNADVTVEGDIAEAKYRDQSTEAPSVCERETPTPAPVLDFAAAKETDARAIATRIMALRPEWAKPAHLTAVELHAISDNLSAFQSLDSDDWALLKDYLGAHVAQGAGFWQPRNRSQMIDQVADILGHALRWAEKAGRRAKGEQREPRAIGVK